MRTAKWMSTVLAILFSFLSYGSVTDHKNPYYPAEFYDHLDHGMRDGDLRNELFAILSRTHVPVGYKAARRILLGEIDLQNTNQGYGILDVYCQKMYTAKDFPGSPPGPGKIPNNSVMNIEHTWPQSLFTGGFNKDMQKSDMHHLFPTEAHVNSVRGNFPFGNVTAVDNTPCQGAVRGYVQGDGNLHFEPPTVQKGNAARAMFYFAVRYKMKISQEQENSLKAWHRLDPVDDAERSRNDAIFAKQKDRNPFVDHPELVELISDY